MTIKQIWKKQLQVEVENVKKCSAVNVGFLTADGTEDEVQLNVDNHILTKSGRDELDELFKSLAKELNTKEDRVLSCTVVGTAETHDKLIEMGF